MKRRAESSDAAMGGVLKLWHDAREAGEYSEEGELPDARRAPGGGEAL